MLLLLNFIQTFQFGGMIIEYVDQFRVRNRFRIFVHYGIVTGCLEIGIQRRILGVGSSCRRNDRLQHVHLIEPHRKRLLNLVRGVKRQHPMCLAEIQSDVLVIQVHRS